ncbi:MAG: hypothetical protein HYV28_10160 [Ignavibacteriales bacterium]|nr:hypothetical protein [Ignavibacteriales bacterium]
MSKTIHRLYIALLLIIGVSSTVLLSVNGYQYYLQPIEDRPFHALHDYFEPAGLLGHGLGILGTLMMILGVSTYMLRKRSIMLKFGFLKHWLEFHIFLCSVGPVFVLFHTAFKFGGIVAVSFWSMVAVVASGVIGRFIYTQIPHSVDGTELSEDDISALNTELSQALKYSSSLSPLTLAKIEAAIAQEKYHVGFLSSTLFVIQDYFRLGSKLKSLKTELLTEGIPLDTIKTHILPVLKQKLVLSRKSGALHSMQRLFKYWHIFHLPFAVSMFVIMVIHVIVTILFGYRWIF